MSNTTPKSGRSGRDSHTARAFDIRTFIALLIGIYGVVLVLTAIFSTSDADLDKAGGVNVNLWAGIGMIVAAAAFQAWALWRPVIVPDKPPAESSDVES
ncbi:MAG: hypothetical protein L0H93_05860 [Nocardioides sp.]|nr:hypothetical protein [Nocardioides sp.]